MALPRELQLIINGVIQEKNHILEWEVFGNKTQDTRAVLTWRRMGSFEKDNQSLVNQNYSGFHNICETVEYKGDIPYSNEDENLDINEKQNIFHEWGNITNCSEDKYNEFSNEQSIEGDGAQQVKVGNNKIDNLAGINVEKMDGERPTCILEVEDLADVIVFGATCNRIEEDFNCQNEEHKERPSGKKCDIDSKYITDSNEEGFLSHHELKNESHGDHITPLTHENVRMNETHRINDKDEDGNIISGDKGICLEKQSISEDSSQLLATMQEIENGELIELDTEEMKDSDSVIVDNVISNVWVGNDDQIKELTKKDKLKVSNEIKKSSRIGAEEKEKIDIMKSETTMMKTGTKYDALKLLEFKRDQFKMTMEQVDSHDANLIENVEMHIERTNSPNNSRDDGYKLKWSNRPHNLVRSDNERAKERHKNMETMENGTIPVIRELTSVGNPKGWKRCMDCRHNDFCDKIQHKNEYLHLLLEDAHLELMENVEDCRCNVCRGGAVHNGCVYREIVRLKTDCRVFDKRNYCYCKECIPFKYRNICLRQELRLMRFDGNDIYYQLTSQGDDGIVQMRYIFRSESQESIYSDDSDCEAAMKLEYIEIEIDANDKFRFSDCVDCQCNGFCDDIRHKKLYIMLLLIDSENFEELNNPCGCFVCVFQGSAHNGCIEREIKRLKYDFMLYDQRNLCNCSECVPFKYRRFCLRQEMKLMRRNKGIDLYHKLS